MTKTVWVVPAAVALLVSLAPAARAGERGSAKSQKMVLGLQPKGGAQAQPSTKAPPKGASAEELLYTNLDYSESHLQSHFFKPVCDYPWTRRFPPRRMDHREPPHPTLEFFCPPVTTYLYYPELYPRSYHAGGTLNVDY